MKAIDIILVIMFLLIAIGVIYGYQLLKQQGVQCVRDPLKYGIKEINRQNNYSLVCTCSMGKNAFTLSEEGVKPFNP